MDESYLGKEENQFDLVLFGFTFKHILILHVLVSILYTELLETLSGCQRQADCPIIHFPLLTDKYYIYVLYCICSSLVPRDHPVHTPRQILIAQTLVPSGLLGNSDQALNITDLDKHF